MLRASSGRRGVQSLQYAVEAWVAAEIVEEGGHPRVREPGGTLRESVFEPAKGFIHPAEARVDHGGPERTYPRVSRGRLHLVENPLRPLALRCRCVVMPEDTEQILIARC